MIAERLHSLGRKKGEKALGHGFHTSWANNLLNRTLCSSVFWLDAFGYHKGYCKSLRPLMAALKQTEHRVFFLVSQVLPLCQNTHIRILQERVQAKLIDPAFIMVQI